MAQSLAGPVHCFRCGEEYPRDPAYDVACPQCNAQPGELCKRPSEHPAWSLHAARDQAAMDAGILKRCPGLPPLDGTQARML